MPLQDHFLFLFFLPPPLDPPPPPPPEAGEVVLPCVTPVPMLRFAPFRFAMAAMNDARCFFGNHRSG